MSEPTRTAVCDATNDPAYERLRQALHDASDALFAIEINPARHPFGTDELGEARRKEKEIAFRARLAIRAALASPEARKENT